MIKIGYSSSPEKQTKHKLLKEDAAAHYFSYFCFVCFSDELLHPLLVIFVLFVSLMSYCILF
jgi:hypothetical protein